MSGATDPLKFLQGESVLRAEIQTLLISSSKTLLEKCAEGLEIEKESRKLYYPLRIHITHEVSEILRTSTDQFLIDYIVLIIDPTNINCLDEAARNMSKIESRFSRDRICMLCITDGYLNMKVEPVNLWEFAIYYQINIIFGDLENQKIRRHTSQRIFNLLEKCCGIKNGIPFTGKV